MTIGQLGVEVVARKVYQIANQFLAVQSADVWSARAVESFISNFYLTPYSYDLGGSVNCIIKAQAGNLPPVPSTSQSFEVIHGLCSIAGESYYLDIGESRVIIDPPSSRHVSVWFGRTPHARHPIAVANTVAYVLQAALRRCFLFDLHAACLIEPVSCAGILFVGTSNSGKSSLAVRLARAGWQYLSDDMVLLNESSEGIVTRGLRRHFAVSASSLANCPLHRLDEALGAPVNSDPSKRRLDPTIIFPNAFAESCIPKMLCFLHLTGEKRSRVENIGQSEVMARLIKHNPWSSYDLIAARDHLRVLGSLVRQTKASVLFAGRDILDDPRQANKLLSAYVNN
jgi:hypothetical protein